MRLPAVQSRGGRGRAQRPAHGELTVLTAREGCTQASSRSSLHRRGTRRPLSELDCIFLSGRPVRRFLGPQGSVLQSISSTNFPVRQRQKARQTAVPLRLPQMLSLCWGPSPQSIWGTGEAWENKFCSVLLNHCCKNHSHLWLGF